LRCSYCPTVKDGWPSLVEADIDTAISLFLTRFGSGDIKLFGGEPLLVPEMVRYAIEKAESESGIRYIYLSTNGLGLNRDWLDFLSRCRKVILTLSMDGEPSDHRAMRKGLAGVSDSYEHVVGLLPELLKTPRLVVTQTIPPKTAIRAHANFKHLLELGFRRFNFLPGYFMPWKASQLLNLEDEFEQISRHIVSLWKAGSYLYVRNLFVRAPTPFFNTGLIVDSDRTIHPCNVGLSSAYDHLRQKTQIGDLDSPPSKKEIERANRGAPGLLATAVEPAIWKATLAADEKLTRFCQRLTPAFLRYRQNRKALA